MTAQPTNPIVERKPLGAGKVTEEMIRKMADDLNKTNFARGYGWHYYVGKVERDGQWFASLERRDA